MTDPYLRQIERANGADDVDCPTCGEPVRLGHVCEGCGFSVADLYADPDRAHDEWKEGRA